MAISALQIPYGNINNTVDPSQWSTLANLGNVYQKAQEQQAQQTALGQLGRGQASDTQALLTSGVPSLAQIGLTMQGQQASRDEQVREFEAQQTIRAAQEKRAQATFEEDSPEARKQKAVSQGWDLKDRGVQAWIITGQNIPGGRAGLGAPTYTRDADGKLHMWQLSSTGEPVEVQFSAGQTPLGPGEVAAQKQEAVSMAKAKATAAIALPKVADQVATNSQALADLENHPGRDNATGKWRGQLPDTSTLLSQDGIDFRSRFNNVKGQAFLSAFDTLRGAGAISNSEGEAAKGAINRLSTVTSAKEFNTALQEAKQYYQLGLGRMQRAARGDFSEHPPELRPADYGAQSGSQVVPQAPLSDFFPRK